MEKRKKKYTIKEIEKMYIWKAIKEGLNHPAWKLK